LPESLFTRCNIFSYRYNK